VKLLRAIQEGEIVPLGESKPVKVDVRIVAATNRTLTEEIASGRFREDLFYRLAVAVLKLPPLRERQGDVGMLIDHLLVAGEPRGPERARLQREEAFCRRKESSPFAPLARQRARAGQHPAPRRHLERWCRRSRRRTSAKRCFQSPRARDAEVLGRPLGGGFNLRDLLKEVARHYLERAMDEAQGNKTKARSSWACRATRR
jgi:transcriptional regulator with GAF, ATPase, and Fis domain